MARRRIITAPPSPKQRVQRDRWATKGSLSALLGQSRFIENHLTERERSLFVAVKDSIKLILTAFDVTTAALIEAAGKEVKKDVRR